jgi:hypothetical protein
MGANTDAGPEQAGTLNCAASGPLPGRTNDHVTRYGPSRLPPAPGPVTGVSAARGGQVVLRWTNPVAADLAGVIVRRYPGPVAPGAPDVGKAAYLGAGSSVRFAAPSARPVAASVWAYDRTGNLSSQHERRAEP